MANTDLPSRLRDPGYFALHLQAAAAIREVGQLGWYDSHFLRRIEVARRYLAQVRPDALGEFTEGLAQLRPRPGFREMLLEDVFSPATCAAIIAECRAAEPVRDARQAGENTSFGREVMWRLPFFLELQERIRPWVAELAGQELVSSYNFLSRYGAEGRCDLHMDAAEAAYTFDYCIDQDAVWPIHVSRVVDWLGGEVPATFAPEQIIADPGLDFAKHLLRPNQALLFNGASQWHYRRPKAGGGYCHLLFFHYYPAGCQNLVVPARWADHFDIPELGPLCDLFSHQAQDALT